MYGDHNKEKFYRDYDYEFGDDMTVAATHCNRFEGRSDISVFNMINYRSCENCKHLTAGDRCEYQGNRR